MRFLFVLLATLILQPCINGKEHDSSVVLTYPFPDPDAGQSNLFDGESEEVFLDRSLVAKQTEDELILEKALSLESKLNNLIFGQHHAIFETSNAILRYAAGINDPNAPIASLLYSGPSGVGKTELAKQLCMQLYGTLARMIRINMAEYSESHTISRLIGAPPGYQGFEQGGQLTNALLKAPYSIVLLDEVEKAHSKVLKLFLQALDEGYITTAMGKIVDCRKCIFILTSNLGALEIADLNAKGLGHTDIVEALKPIYMRELSPELFNRIDLILFSNLSPQVLEALINKMLLQLAERVNKAKKMQLQFDKSIVEYFMKYCLDPKLGARPLKRLIDKELATVVAKAIIDGKCTRGDTLNCYYRNGYIIVEKR